MAVALVAGITGATSKTSGTTLAIPNCTSVAGELVVVGFAMDPTSGTVSCADDAGNTYQKDADIANGSTTSGVRTVIFSSRHTTGLNGTQNITITLPTATAKAAAAARFSGVATASWKDASATGTGSASPWTSTATGTPAQADEVVVGAIGIERLTSDFTTIGTSMTPDQANTGGTPVGTSGGGAATNISLVLMYAIQTTATAQTADYTSTTSSVNYAAACVTYKGISTTPPNSVNVIRQAVQRATGR